MEIILAPDIYVNASVALGSPPDQVARRLLGGKRGSTKTSEWVLARVHQMLRALPAFKEEAVDAHVDARRLEQRLVVGVDPDPTLREQPPDRPVGEDHGAILSSALAAAGCMSAIHICRRPVAAVSSARWR